jgi:glycosyltransferase involved in cell wall biosynthesis
LLGTRGSPNLRIAHIIPNLAGRSGGPARSVLKFAEALAARGHHVRILYGGTPDDVSLSSQSPLIQLVRMKEGGGNFITGIEISRFLRRNSDVDVLLIHSIWNSITTLCAAQARSSRLPYILCPHGMLTNVCLRRHSLRKRLFHIYDRKTVAGAVAVRFLTDAERDMSLLSYVRFGHSFVVPNGVDVPTRTPDRGKGRLMWPQLGQGPVITFMGRLHQIKNLGLQLEVLRLLVPKFPTLRWTLIGPDDGELSGLLTVARRHGIQDHIVWLGPIFSDDRFLALAASDLLLQTSFHEAHSMTVNEALSIGIPVVATESVNFPELGRVGAGFVVPSDAAVVADHVAKVLADKQLGMEMGRRGREYARTRLSWGGIAKDFEDRMVELLPQREGSGVQ